MSPKPLISEQECDDVGSRILTLTEEIQRLNKTLEDLAGAFPKDDDGTPDFRGHHDHHARLIKAAQAQERFWNELRLDVAKKGLWGLLVIVVGLAIVGIQVKLGIGGPKAP